MGDWTGGGGGGYLDKQQTGRVNMRRGFYHISDLVKYLSMVCLGVPWWRLCVVLSDCEAVYQKMWHRMDSALNKLPLTRTVIYLHCLETRTVIGLTADPRLLLVKTTATTWYVRGTDTCLLQSCQFVYKNFLLHYLVFNYHEIIAGSVLSVAMIDSKILPGRGRMSLPTRHRAHLMSPNTRKFCIFSTLWPLYDHTLFIQIWMDFSQVKS